MGDSHWVEGIRLLVFCGFVGLGVAVLLAKTTSVRRRRINLFLVCTLIINFEVGFSQIDCWPFSHYPLMRGVWNEHFRYQKIFLVGIDSSGTEWPLDPATWSPVFPLVLQAWFQMTFDTLDANQKLETARFLDSRAELARARLLSGKRLGNERYLGVLTAPDWWLYRRQRSAPTTPYAGIRVYRESFEPAQKWADPNRTERVLIYEYRPVR